MTKPDLNLLFTLDVLLAQGSVARAARRLRLSPSAMSRALARLRETTGDPLLVRAGRKMVPSPRALELREQVSQLVHDAEAVLRPTTKLRLDRLQRTFTLRVGDGFVENFGAALLARVATEAPGVRLRFVPKPDKDSEPLREGRVDLETGVIGGTTGPEIRTQALLRDRFIGVVRPGHPLAQGELTAARYATARHVLVSRRGADVGPVHDALAGLRLERDIAVTVGTWSAALALVRDSELVATVPEGHTRSLCTGMACFALPMPVAPITVSLLWHPRLDADAAHRWLRGCVRNVCAGVADGAMAFSAGGPG